MMQDFWVQVFNQRRVDPLEEDVLLRVLFDANYTSLCAQYGLDPQGIPAALAHLELIAAPEKIAPFFLLKYRPGDQAPLVIYRWESGHETGARWLKEAEHRAQGSEVRLHLGQTREILGVALRSPQLLDMGLTLAYEIARWAAAKGEGLVYGLDGTWYRLNRHLAFLPLEKE